MVATRHCCWGKCNNDSRYPERLPDSLKEMLKNGQKALIPFPKPKHDLELCQRWVNACSRQNFLREKCQLQYLHLCCTPSFWVKIRASETFELDMGVSSLIFLFSRSCLFVLIAVGGQNFVTSRPRSAIAVKSYKITVL